MTARQPVKKLTAVHGSFILGIAGSVGLSQFFQEAVQSLWDKGALKGKQPIEGMGIIRDAIRPHAVREIQTASVTRSALGDHVALQSALCSTLVAINLARTPSLFQFDHQCCPEAATAELPFVAIGSGQPIADPFLSFLRRVLWPKRLPMLAEGVFATLWTLNHAIATHPGGVSAPVQIMTLTLDGVHELESAELTEQEQAIEAAEKALSGFRDYMRSGQAPEPPTPHLISLL